MLSEMQFLWSDDDLPRLYSLSKPTEKPKSSHCSQLKFKQWKGKLKIDFFGFILWNCCLFLYILTAFHVMKNKGNCQVSPYIFSSMENNVQWRKTLKECRKWAETHPAGMCLYTPSSFKQLIMEDRTQHKTNTTFTFQQSCVCTRIIDGLGLLYFQVSDRLHLHFYWPAALPVQVSLQGWSRGFPDPCWCNFPTEDKLRVFPVDIRKSAPICWCNHTDTHTKKEWTSCVHWDTSGTACCSTLTDRTFILLLKSLPPYNDIHTVSAAYPFL